MGEPVAVLTPLSQRAAILGRSPLFETVEPADLEALAELASAAAYRADETVFRKGDQSRVLYVVDRGRVRIAAGAAGPDLEDAGRPARTPARYEDAVFMDLPTRLAQRLLFQGDTSA